MYILCVSSCSHCGCALEEEEPEDAGVDSRQLMSQSVHSHTPTLTSKIFFGGGGGGGIDKSLL